MRVLYSILGALALLSVVPQARTFFLKDTCSLEYLNCRMKCNLDEHAIKYCADWTICCKAKNTKFKRKKKW
ncbi:beta-defensin 43 [Canis lupus familiaris]|uniref:Beta-defensin n=2 Tax=Canis lupus familiaris TaxID=9615 RepID=Q30KS3_CANLF|nr:beta-defensin 43 [Canis lupus familiaris]XP_038290549.1 beta-defensin 43 [Canis lupus familiaris]AAY59737.1 beta-defensin 131 [Canis lupus familiaris]|eukprot:XP_022265676.1 beta-defensin 43 [Canis lupus familiaris]